MSPVNQILLVEDDPVNRDLVADALALDGHHVTTASRGDEGLALLQERGFQAVVTDLMLPGSNGLDLVTFAVENLPGTPVIVISGYGSVDSAVEAMRRGAFDFQEKPLNLEHLRLTVSQALRKAVLGYAFDYLRREQPYIYKLEHIVAESPAMKDVLEKVKRVADAEVTVLLTGETGTGKSLVAGAIHANSARREHTVVTVNCAALAETLLESELFGHEKGAFTGAHKTRIGRFQQAHGGTLFLDEVGDMSPATQAKTLRAIEDKEIRPVGGARNIQVDVRIIAATNVDLEQAVAQGRFRADLYYRLSVTPINIPPLRERVEDIVPLAELFLHKLSGESKRPYMPYSDTAREALKAYTWPGNIRELRNAVERAILFANGPEIGPADLGLAPGKSTAAAGAELPTLDLKELERQAIVNALEDSEWVQRQAANLLGITPRALSYKLKSLDINHPELEARRRPR